jgi:hypothetical protein
MALNRTPFAQFLQQPVGLAMCRFLSVEPATTSRRHEVDSRDVDARQSHHAAMSCDDLDDNAWRADLSGENRAGTSSNYYSRKQTRPVPDATNFVCDGTDFVDTTPSFR